MTKQEWVEKWGYKDVNQVTQRMNRISDLMDADFFEADHTALHNAEVALENLQEAEDDWCENVRD